MRGDGFTYKQGKRWWVGFRAGGKLHREPARIPDKAGVLRPAKSEAEARRYLRARREDVLGGRFLGLHEERLMVSELLDAAERRAKTKGLRSLPKMQSHAKPLRSFFALTRAVDVTTDMVEQFKVERQDEGRAGATINRELEILRLAYRLAVKAKQLSGSRGPEIELLPVENTRTGFFDASEIAALLAHIHDQDLHDFIWWGFLTGQRKGEIAQLEWEMLDRSSDPWTLNVPGRIAKTKTGRVIGLAGEVRRVIERRLAGRRLDCPLIFHRTSKGQPGQPVKAFDKAWRNALKEAKLPPGRLFHDLRRSAVKSLIKAGVDQQTAMLVSGHKTASMFSRYRIIEAEETAAALARVGEWLATQPKKRNVAGFVGRERS